MACGKAQEGFSSPVAPVCPWAQPIEKQQVGQGIPNASWSQQFRSFILCSVIHHLRLNIQNLGCPGGWSVAGT